MTELVTALWQALDRGLPILLLHFFTTLLLLALGVAAYVGLTPFRERELIRDGNAAAGLVLGGALVSLAIPLAATLATSTLWLDIVLWGSIAVLLQLVVLWLFDLAVRGLRTAIEAGNIAVAAVLVGVQLAIAVLNAGAMAG